MGVNSWIFFFWIACYYGFNQVIHINPQISNINGSCAGIIFIGLFTSVYIIGLVKLFRFFNLCGTLTNRAVSTDFIFWQRFCQLPSNWSPVINRILAVTHIGYMVFHRGCWSKNPSSINKRRHRWFCLHYIKVRVRCGRSVAGMP